MKLLIDGNILLDVLQKRERHYLEKRFPKKRNYRMHSIRVLIYLQGHISILSLSNRYCYIRMTYKTQYKKILRYNARETLLEKVIKAGRYASSGGNSQTTHIIVFTEQTHLDELAALVQDELSVS